MKVDIGDVKKGNVLNIDGVLYKVVDISHTHTGRGSATFSLKVKDIINNNTNTFTYKSGTNLEKEEVNTKNATYLYNTGDTYFFMENDTSEIYEIDKDDISDIIPYLKENLSLFIMIHNEKIIGVILPNVVTYKVIETTPGVKGDRATAGKKPAKIETGAEVNVPMHVEEGDEIKLNTLTGEVN